jgi:hypothetical protein
MYNRHRMTTSAAIRQSLIDTLRTDLVGPGPGHPLEAEQLWDHEPPSRWYLTGFLVPREAPDDQRFDPESQETLDAPLGDDEGPGDDNDEPDSAPAKKAFLPSSIGMSVLVPQETTELQAEVRWGDYKKTPVPDPAHPDRKVWQRTQRTETVLIALDPTRPLRPPEEVPNARGLQVYVSTRKIDDATARELQLSIGTRAVSVFVVNERDPKAEDRADEANVFQVELVLRSPAPFVARPNVRGLAGDDPDEKIADVQYRDDFEYAVGHGIATVATLGDAKTCREVHTAWMPDASVEKVEPPGDAVPARVRPAEPRGASLAFVLMILVTHARSGRSSTSCSSRPAAARPRRTSASPRSPWSSAGSATPASPRRASAC